jgi:hypothetical protein
MDTLTVKANTTGTTTITGAWELRAGSASTTEWLDGAADVAYPGNLGGFVATNSDGANGYDAAPKMALLSMTTAGNSTVVVLEGAGIAGHYASFVTQVSGTASTSVPTIVASSIAGDADTDGITELTLTLTSVGVGTGVFNVMVMFS